MKECSYKDCHEPQVSKHHTYCLEHRRLIARESQRRRSRDAMGLTKGYTPRKQRARFDGVCECGGDVHYPGFQDEFDELLSRFGRDGYTVYMARYCPAYSSNKFEVLGKNEHWKAVRYIIEEEKKYVRHVSYHV